MSRSRGIAVLRIGVLIVMLYLLVRHVLDNREDYTFVGTLNWSLLPAIALLSVLNLLIEAARFSATAREMDCRVPVFKSFVYLVVARFLDKFVPQSGVVYKIQVLRRTTALGMGKVFAGFGSLVWLQLFVSLLIAWAAVSVYRPALQIGEFSALILITLAIVLLLFGTVVAAYLAARLAQYRPSDDRLWRRISNRLGRHLRTLLGLIRNPRLMAMNAVAIVAATLLSAMRLYFCFRMVGVDADIAAVTLFVSLNRAASVFSITPGNLGIKEVLFGVLAEQLSLGMAQGIVVAALLRVVMLAVLATLGLFFVLFARRIVFGITNTGTN